MKAKSASPKEKLATRPSIDLERLPTPAEIRTLRAFHAFLTREKRDPTIRELSDELGLASNSAQRRLDGLVSKGYVVTEQVVVAGRRKISPAGKKWL